MRILFRGEIKEEMFVIVLLGCVVSVCVLGGGQGSDVCVCVVRWCWEYGGVERDAG